MNILNYCFRDTKYDIVLTNKNNKEKYVLEAKSTEWYADPFVLEDDGRVFVFFELYKLRERQGCIAVSQLLDNKFTKPKIIIDEGIHMSFPNIFKHNNEYYMIPESCQAKQIRLYKAIEFPYKWKLEKVLLDNVVRCDSIIDWKNKLLISYDQDTTTLYVYRFDITNLSVEKLIKEIPDAYGNGILRPAGNVITYKGQTIRPAQLSSQFYGEGILFYKNVDLENFKEEIYNDKEFPYLQYVIPYMLNHKIRGIHTLNESDNYITIDLYNSYYSINVFINRVVFNINKVRKRHKKY